jgi:hypothetical protein
MALLVVIGSDPHGLLFSKEHDWLSDDDNHFSHPQFHVSREYEGTLLLLP